MSRIFEELIITDISFTHPTIKLSPDQLILKCVDMNSLPESMSIEEIYEKLSHTSHTSSNTTPYKSHKHKITYLTFIFQTQKLSSTYIPSSHYLDKFDILYNVYSKFLSENTYQIVNKPQLNFLYIKPHVCYLIRKYSQCSNTDETRTYEQFVNRISHKKSKAPKDILVSNQIDNISSNVFNNSKNLDEGLQNKYIISVQTSEDIKSLETKSTTKQDPRMKSILIRYCKDYSISDKKMYLFFINWYIFRTVRRLHYLGITRETIEKYSWYLYCKNPLQRYETKQCVYLYRQIVTNPFQLFIEDMIDIDQAVSLLRVFNDMRIKENVDKANLLYNTAVILYRCRKEFVEKGNTSVPSKQLIFYEKKIVENMVKEKVAETIPKAINMLTEIIEKEFGCKFVAFNFDYEKCLPPSKNSKSILAKVKSKTSPNIAMIMKDEYDKYTFIKQYIEKLDKQDKIHDFETLMVRLRTIYNKDVECKNKHDTSDITDTQLFKQLIQDKQLNDDQINAVMLSVCSNFTFILGSAGTGKTRVITELTSYIDRQNQTSHNTSSHTQSSNKTVYYCLAYTGKAVSKLSSVINKSQHSPRPMTIDLFKTKLVRNTIDINTNIKHLAIIIDEVSMITTDMIYSLMYIINEKCKCSVSYTFFGDKFQLQPIIGRDTTKLSMETNNGQFLHNISLSSKVIIYELTTVHRYTNGLSKNATIVRDAITENYYPMNPKFYDHLYEYYKHQQENKKIYKLTQTEDFQIYQVKNFDEHLPGYDKLSEIITELLHTTDPTNFKILTPKLDHCSRINKLCSRLYHSRLNMNRRNNKIAVMSSNTNMLVKLTDVYSVNDTSVSLTSNTKLTTDNTYSFTEGDPVMVSENVGPHNIFNGEEFVVESIDTDGITCILYDKLDITGKSDKKKIFNYYDSSEAKDLNYTSEAKCVKKIEDIKETKTDKDEEIKTLTTEFIKPSYCITCHKSQGSEWDTVVIYIPKGGMTDGFIDASMIYTSITRAKKKVYLVGDVDTVNEIINTPIMFKADVFYGVIDG